MRFSKAAASYIDRQKKWHPTEVRKRLPDGSIELSFRVTGVSEIKGWIYSWLPEVEVIKPGWLRAEVKKELLQAVENYK
ncbi:MAG: WYL domain-containing protein [Deltaproteobacteria bacterium]|nr:WYL domain-containing protein [Deltaproteobacteria bacterium]MCL5277824.1 WYL domain-containing protein [Deltaproteobacteria bacterium]